MTKPLRWGILGAAKFAREHMAPAMMLAKNTELAALATSSADKAAAFTSLHPSLQIHSDYDALLNDPAIGAVYLPLPNHLHVEWVKCAVEAGKHVLCEKPIAMQADEIDELITLRDRAGVLVAEAYMIVHHPQWHYAKELVDAGEIGTVQQIDTVFSYNNAADTGNIRNRAETGGGGLRDIGVYTLGCARYVMGAEFDAFHHVDLRLENDVDVWASVTGRIADVRYQGVTSMRMALRQSVNIQGDQGVITLTAPFNPGVYSQAEVHVSKGDMTVKTKRFPTANHYVHQLENFQNSVTQSVVYPCPLEFSRGTQSALDRIFEMAK
jgi:predicted dehydrogenase